MYILSRSEQTTRTLNISILWLLFFSPQSWGKLFEEEDSDTQNLSYLTLPNSSKLDDDKQKFQKYPLQRRKAPERWCKCIKMFKMRWRNKWMPNM